MNLRTTTVTKKTPPRTTAAAFWRRWEKTPGPWRLSGRDEIRDRWMRCPWEAAWRLPAGFLGMAKYLPPDALRTKIVVAADNADNRQAACDRIRRRLLKRVTL